MFANKTDRELIELYTKHSDCDAFAELLLRHKGLIEGQSLALMGNAADADDLSQEIAISLMSKLGLFKGESNFATWLYRLNYRLGLDALRKRKNYEGRKKDARILDFVASPKRQIISSDFSRLIEDLSPEHRTLVYFRIHKDLGFSEIAKILNKKEQAVKMMWYRLLQELKRELPANYHELVEYEYV